MTETLEIPLALQTYSDYEARNQNQFKHLLYYSLHTVPLYPKALNIYGLCPVFCSPHLNNGSLLHQVALLGTKLQMNRNVIIHIIYKMEQKMHETLGREARQAQISTQKVCLVNKDTAITSTYFYLSVHFLLFIYSVSLIV